MQLSVRCDCGTVLELARQVLEGEPLRVRCPGCEEMLAVGNAEWAGLQQLPPQPPAAFRGLIAAHPGAWPGGPSPA